MAKLTGTSTHYFLSLLLFIFVCHVYFHLFGDIAEYPAQSFWERPGNIHDHYVYAYYDDRVDSVGFRIAGPRVRLNPRAFQANYHLEKLT